MPRNGVSQAHRQFVLKTPLGEDVLLFRRMTVTEHLGRPFQFDLDCLSNDPQVKFEDLLGQVVTIRYQGRDDFERFFNGHVTRFVQSGMHGDYHVYHAEVRPWLWFLTRTADCRIFQAMTVPDIVKQVFRDLGFTDFKESLSGSYREWEYCVQYRETDFNFVNRLLEQEGIYYYFEHDDGKHTLVLADDVSAHAATEGYEEIPYFPRDTSGRRERDHIYAWQRTQEIHPDLYAVEDYDFTKPKSDLQVKASVQPAHKATGYEIYDYPGEYRETSDGQHYVDARIQELHAQHERIQGQGDAAGLKTGKTFKLTGHYRDDQNGKEYLVVSASYELTSDDYESGAGGGGEEPFHCAFVAIDAKVAYRPPRITPKPVVQGPQTALVVGKSGEEIWTDEYGRIRVQFHWDRYGKEDENSSCWVRVSTPWAGKNWGAVHIPRMGQEVVVSFEEGDPDRPLVTGSVYNADNMPPYELPANKTQSGIKSRSTKGAEPANFNEIRFEDKKGEEQLYIHAEKNQDNIVENDETTSVGNNRTESVGKNEKIDIGENREETVGKNETINIGENRSESVGKNESISIGESRDETVGKNETVNIGGNRNVQVAKEEQIQVGDSRTLDVGKDNTVNVGKSLLINAADEIVLKTGSATMVMKKNGDITIKGKNITTEGSGKITEKASGDVILKGSKILQN